MSSTLTHFQHGLLKFDFQFVRLRGTGHMVVGIRHRMGDSLILVSYHVRWKINLHCNHLILLQHSPQCAHAIDPLRQTEWNQYDPGLGDAGPGRPRYWWVNFARAEHPRKYTFTDGSYQICPKNCTKSLEHAQNVTGAKGRDCKGTWPTILGSYWEWVWGPVGTANPGVGYMHRPSSFPMVQVCILNFN